MVAGLTERMGYQGAFLFVLLVLASLLHNVPAEKRKLDMAPDAIDDKFLNCLEKMMKVVTKPGGLLQKELETSSDFAKVWKKGDETICEKQIPGGNKYHTTALQAYGNSDSKFRKQFNDLVYSKGTNRTTYVDGFPFKSLHFLLTDAFRLANSSKSCVTRFYGTTNQYTAKIKEEVRFGKFIRAEIQHSAAAETAMEEDGTLFNITSCSAINVDDYTCKSEEISHLISPNEVFRVKNITKVKTADGTYNEITLTHSRFLINHDCYLLGADDDDNDDDDDDDDSSSVQLSCSVLALIASILICFTLLE
ncbi:ecto-ADP-ribosyltransferase 5 [Trichomycterus rosablanca]|uniref:ecto-ADP-ribosyltransferase 5 n=1 Tax=Trichomycterus rosablanca TaxID=2290929 RepID=UPI002F35DDEC